MSEVAVKPIVLELLRHARQEEQTWLDGLTDAERATTGTPGQWSTKNILAHIAAWKQLQAQKLATAISGETPPRWRDHALIDRINAETFAAYQDQSWQAVLDESY
jgi:hypothetical protein